MLVLQVSVRWLTSAHVQTLANFQTFNLNVELFAVLCFVMINQMWRIANSTNGMCSIQI